MRWPTPVNSECRAHFEMHILTVKYIFCEDCDWPEVQNTGSLRAFTWDSFNEAIWLNSARAKK